MSCRMRDTLLSTEKKPLFFKRRNPNRLDLFELAFSVDLGYLFNNGPFRGNCFAGRQAIIFLGAAAQISTNDNTLSQIFLRMIVMRY
jgi:hypothetical protein